MLGKEFFKRAVFSVLFLSIVSFLIYVSAYPSFQIFVALLISLLAVFALKEFISFCSEKYQMNKSLIFFSSFFIVFSFYLSSLFSALESLPFFLFFLFFFLLFLTHLKKINNAIGSLAVSSFMQLYISVPLGLLLFILVTPEIMGLDGRFWILYLIIVTKITDVVAYISGKLIGKRPLASKISPQKTFEGAFFGWIAAVAASPFFFWILEHFFNKPSVSMGVAIFLGCILGVLGQLGDLFESLLKRDAKVKNSSSIPGLGGILDMLDSLIVNIFVLYFFLNLGI